MALRIAFDVQDSANLELTDVNQDTAAAGLPSTAASFRVEPLSDEPTPFAELHGIVWEMSTAVVPLPHHAQSFGIAAGAYNAISAALRLVQHGTRVSARRGSQAAMYVTPAAVGDISDTDVALAEEDVELADAASAIANADYDDDELELAFVALLESSHVSALGISLALDKIAPPAQTTFLQAVGAIAIRGSVELFSVLLRALNDAAHESRRLGATLALESMASPAIIPFLEHALRNEPRGYISGAQTRIIERLQQHIN